jgi:arginase
MTSRPISLVLCSTNLGLQPTGVEGLGETLVSLGLAERLGAEIGATLTASPFDPVVDPATGLANVPAMAEFARRQADVLSHLLDTERFPLVLGGDDSVLFGCLLALRRQGQFGLLFLDGHTDFYPPSRSPLGEASDCDLLIATGRGPEPLSDLDGVGPLVRDAAVAVYGHRDRSDQLKGGSLDVYETEMLVRNLGELRAAEMPAAGANAVAHMGAGAPDGIWIHVDADVLHDDVMPAVDWRLPDGLWPEEFGSLLATILLSGRVVGMDVTIYNPAKDSEDRIAGRRLVDLLVDLLT